MITKIAKKRDVQIILSTHSRHMIDGLRKKAQVVWLSKGSLVQPPDGEGADLTAILLDLGALDSIDYFSNGQTRFVVATEDDDTACLEEILWASGFVRDEVEVVSYTGCTKIDSAIVLGRFLRDKAPNVRMIVHRDRDYMSDDSVSEFQSALQQHGIIPFVTVRSDIEHYYFDIDHLQECCPSLGREELNQLVEQSVSETRDKSIEAIVNLRTEQAFRQRNRGGAAPNHGKISVEAVSDYDANPRAMSRGKLVLKRVRHLLRQKLGGNVRVHLASAALSIPELRAIAEAVLDDSTSQLSASPTSAVLVVDTDGVAARNVSADVVNVENAIGAPPPFSQTSTAGDSALSPTTDGESDLPEAGSRTDMRGETNL